MASPIAGMPLSVPDISDLFGVDNLAYIPPLTDLSKLRIQAEERAAGNKHDIQWTTISPVRFGFSKWEIDHTIMRCDYKGYFG